MAISFVNKGTWSGGNGSILPGLPASMETGDFCLLFVESANEAINITTQGSISWTKVTNSPVSTGTAATARGVRLTVYYGWWTSGTTAPTIADSGNHTTGIIMAFRGVDTTTPFDGVTPVATVDSAVTTTLTPPGITTQTDNALVVYAMGLDADASTNNPAAIIGTPANANLTNLTKQHAQTISTGVGGGIGVITGFKAIAGASGNITGATKPSSTTAYLTLSLREQIAVNITVTVPTTTTHTITEGSGTTITVTSNIAIDVISESSITITEGSGATVDIISNIIIDTTHSSSITISEGLGTTISTTTSVTIDTTPGSSITIAEELGTSVSTTQSTIIDVTTPSIININNDSPTVIVFSVIDITITIPNTSNITILEEMGITVSGAAVVTIDNSSDIHVDNNNPTISTTGVLMTISNTLQIQVGNLFIEGSETSLSPNGTLTMIEFIEGSTIDFNSSGVLTAFEFIEGGI